MKMNKARITYLIIFFSLVFIEILIALFLHDKFIRPYVGDILIIGVLYSFVKILVPNKIKLLPIYIFIFAAVIELLQYLKLIELLGLSNNSFARVLIGSTFDIKDIICYAIGAGIILAIEKLVMRHK